MKRRLLLLLPFLFVGVLAFLFFWTEAQSFPSPQGWGGEDYAFVCPTAPPESIPQGAGCPGAWSRVKWVMADSGCPRGAGDCWTDWITVRNPHAWYECVGARRVRGWGVLDGSPPSPPEVPYLYSPFIVDDPRALCQDENCVEKWARGTWYLNAVARPVFGPPRCSHGLCIYECTWVVPPYPLYHWFFGETGNCYDCVCIEPPTPTPAPNPTSGPTPTPLPTECVPGTPTPPGTVTPPASPTPLPPPPEPALAAKAWVRPPVGNRPPNVPREGDWTEIGDTLYWLWQLQLYIRPWARVTNSAPGAAFTVEEYYPMRIGPDSWSAEERRVCPNPLTHDSPPAPKNTLYSADGWREFCKWRGEDDPLRLLWSRFPMEPEKPEEKKASLNQYDVTPWTQDWVVIDYKVMVRVDYSCGDGLTCVGFHYKDLSIRVKLWKPVRVPLR